MTDPLPPGTRGVWLAESIRVAIVEGRLRPGSNLNVRALAEQYSVSPTPIREAVALLAADGLVELLPQRGARVSEVSIGDLLEVYDLRLLLEPLALQATLAQRTPAWTASLDAAAADLFRTLDSADESFTTAEQSHMAFHELLLDGASAPMRRTIRGLSEHCRRYRALGYRRRGGPEGARAEHAQMHQVCRDGNDAQAVALLRQHLTFTLDVVIDAGTTEPHHPTAQRLAVPGQ